MESIKEYVLANNAENIKDINRNGLINGYSNFIYYRDTVKFHDEHEAEIWDMLDTAKEELGKDSSIIQFIATLNGIKDVGSMDQLKNLLTWYAVESVCREIENAGEIPKTEE